jgi:hypothetical protein
MTDPYIPAPPWDAPKFAKPSPAFRGEQSTEPVHFAVGRALSSWEHAVEALVKLYQVLCESSDALEIYREFKSWGANHQREQMIGKKAEQFFSRRDTDDLVVTRILLSYFKLAVVFRHRIAHGVAVQPHEFGYFLCPPSFSKDREEAPDPRVEWGYGAQYFYRVLEIDQCRSRFGELMGASMSLALYLNEKYAIIDPRDFHP